MSSDRQRGITPTVLADAMEQLISQAGDDARLVKNRVGNLSVIREGAYVGFVDLGSGEVSLQLDDPWPWT